MNWLPDWLTGYDAENAARAAAADAELRRIKDERIRSGYYTPEQAAAVELNYSTDAFLNELEARRSIGKAFDEGWDEGRRNVSDTISGTLNRVVFEPLRAVIGGIPAWLWLAAVAVAFWYLGGFRWLRNKIAALAILAAAVVPISQVHAGEIRLAWNPSPTVGVTNYVLNISQGTNAARVSVGTNLTATVSATTGVWTIFATAQKDGVESEPSNTIAVEVPEAPGTVRTFVVENAATINGTNWHPVGFFRIRVQ